jgi:hypothetical protein
MEAIKVTLLVPPKNDAFEKVVFRVLSTRPVPPRALPNMDARKVCFWPVAAGFNWEQLAESCMPL